MQSVTRYGYLFFFFNDTATTEIYTLSLHDALPICSPKSRRLPAPKTRLPPSAGRCRSTRGSCFPASTRSGYSRSEEHTSELQSRQYLVCRLLLEKKKRSTLSYARKRRGNCATTTHS